MWQPPHWGAAEGGACVCDYFISYVFIDIPYIFHRYYLDMIHILSVVCFLIYGVKSRSGHDRSQTVGPISHFSGQKTDFLR